MADYENFILMCRACMCCSTPTDPIELHSIHGFARINEVIDVQTIAERYISLIPALNIEADDGLPQQICLECLTKVLQQHQFRDMCLRAEQQLRMLQDKAKFSAAALSEPTMITEMLSLRLVAEIDALKGCDVTMTPAVPDPLKGCDIIATAEPVMQEAALKECANTELQQGALKDQQADMQKDEQKLPQSSNDSSTNKLVDEVKQLKIDESTEDSCSSDDLDVESLKPQTDGRKIRRKLACKVYRKQFHDLGRHLQMHSTVGRPYKCGHCDYHFVSIAKLKSHETKMHNIVQFSNVSKGTAGADTNFICNKCQLRLPNADAMAQHLEDHQQLKPHNEKTNHNCDKCEKSFCSAVALSNHQRYHKKTLTMRNDNRTYKCEFCKKTYHQLLSLREHISTHTGEQPYLCSVCGKGFTSAGNMKQHLMRHSGILRYECPQCPRRFPCLSDLISHKKQVHEEPKYGCQQCASRFARPSLLKKHMMYHTGERPFECPHCDKRFVCSDHMRRHMRTHTGEKPYKCEYCERVFAQSNDLIKHLRSHMGENVYQCQLCPLAFRLASELRKHFTVHKDESDMTSSGIVPMPVRYQHSDKEKPG